MKPGSDLGWRLGLAWPLTARWVSGLGSKSVPASSLESAVPWQTGLESGSPMAMVMAMVMAKPG